jgi:hypothetical protein
MFSGQTMLCGVGQNAAQHTAQGVARQNVISDVIGRHTLVLYFRWFWVDPPVWSPVPWPVVMRRGLSRPPSDVTPLAHRGQQALSKQMAAETADARQIK